MAQYLMVTFNPDEPFKFPPEPVKTVFVPPVKGAKAVALLVDTEFMVSTAIGTQERQIPLPPDKAYTLLKHGCRVMLNAMRELRRQGKDK